MKLIRLLFILCTLSSHSTLYAQKLHIVVFCDTNDRSIGQNKESERKITVNEMQTIAGYLEEYGYDSEITECYGDNCNKDNLMRTINGLEIAPNDIFFFYYGGHGSHALENENDRFPQMCLGESFQENFVPVSLLKNIVMNKNPRLAIILTGCCNKEQRGISVKSIVAQAESYTYESDIDKEAYKNLFIDNTGLVMMTSSKLGQYSYSGPEGGVFCLTFWLAMEYAGKGKLNPDWNYLCEAVKQSVAQIPIQTNDGIVYQEPDYIVEPIENKTSVNTIPGTKNTTKHTVNVNSNRSTLANDLKKLLDKNLDIDSRLRLVPETLSKHFASGAKVRTLGRDMSTVVDYEDAETFLQRIAMSPFIKQINIVDENGNKNSILTVHEVRTR